MGRVSSKTCSLMIVLMTTFVVHALTIDTHAFSTTTVANRSEERTRKPRKAESRKDGRKKQIPMKADTARKSQDEGFLQDLESDTYRFYVTTLREHGLSEYLVAQKDFWKLYSALLSSIFFFILGVFFWSRRRVPIPTEFERDDDGMAQSSWTSLIRPRSRKPINASAVDALMQKALQVNRLADEQASQGSSPEKSPPSATTQTPPVAPTPAMVAPTPPAQALAAPAPPPPMSMPVVPPPAPVTVSSLSEEKEFDRSETSGPKRVARHPSVPLPPQGGDEGENHDGDVEVPTVPAVLPTEVLSEESAEPAEDTAKAPVLDLFSSMQADLNNEDIVELAFDADSETKFSVPPSSHHGVVLTLSEADGEGEEEDAALEHDATLSLEPVAISPDDVLASVRLYAEILAHFESWRAAGLDCYELLHERYQLTWIDWKDIGRAWKKRFGQDEELAERLRCLREEYARRVGGTRDVS